MYGFVYRRMVGSSSVEDVVAEAYLLAARFFHRYDPKRAQFSTWVTRIAINCMATHYNRERLTVTLDDVSDSLAFEEDTSYIENQELVERLTAVLDERERRLVELKYGDGMRNVEIAEELHMNPSTVSTVLSRAVAKMRTAYGQSSSFALI